MSALIIAVILLDGSIHRYRILPTTSISDFLTTLGLNVEDQGPPRFVNARTQSMLSNSTFGNQVEDGDVFLQIPKLMKR